MKTTTLDPVHYARRWKTLGVLALSLVIIGLDNTILNVALPTLQDEFGASPSKLQWMVDSYLLVFAGMLLVFGTLGDRLGRKLALQAGVSIFGLASLGALVADSANDVIAVRAAMGVGAALIMPPPSRSSPTSSPARNVARRLASGLPWRQSESGSAP
jgi:MFS family permease